MSLTFSLADHLAVADLRVFLQRAARVENASVRLVAGSGVLAVYAAVLYPRGLLDSTPTVLGLRTFSTDADASLDAVVPIRSLLDRLARLPQPAPEPAVAQEAGPVGIRLPTETGTATWAGVAPPRSGWRSAGTVAFDVLEAVTRAGIDEIATAIPSGTGEQIVQRVRSQVWSRPVGAQPHEPQQSQQQSQRMPAGAAFAASSLGFLHPGEPAAVYESGSWLRLSTRRGHVLVHARGAASGH